MSLITKDNLQIVLQAIKKLLSFKADKSELKLKADKSEMNLKADKSEVDLKVDKSEFSDDNAIELSTEMGLVSPIADNDNSIFTDENGVVFSL